MTAAALAEPANPIIVEQEMPRQLMRFAAQRQAYFRAERIFAVHGVLAGPVAAAWTAGAIVLPVLNPYGIAWGFALSLVDLLQLQPRQDRLRFTGARIQEAIDCELFRLPPSSLKVGAAVSDDDIAELATEYEQREPDLKSLREWYSPKFRDLPLHAARLGCQEANIMWDGRQRRSYAMFVLWGLIVFILLVVALGIVFDVHGAQIATALIGPAAPAILFFARQYKENMAAAARLQTLGEQLDRLKERLFAGASAQELLEGSRALQDELFEHRRKNVPVFDWLYFRLRGKNEVIMHRSAAQFVERWHSREAASSTSVSAALPGVRPGFV